MSSMRDSFSERLAPAVALVEPVPEADLGFAMTPAQVHFPIIVEQIRKIHESEAQVLRGAAELQNLLEAPLHLPGAFHDRRGLLLPRFTVDRGAARERDSLLLPLQLGPEGRRGGVP